MNSRTFSTAEVRADMIQEALVLLSIVDAEQSNEDINEGPEARATRIRMRATARQLVAQMITEIRAAESRETQTGCFAAL